MAVSGGTLDIILRNPTGFTGYWFANGLEIATVGQLPTVAPQMLDGVLFDEDGMEDSSRQRLEQLTQTGTTLTPALVEEFKARAIANWTAVGLTAEQVSRLTSSTIEISDLDDEGALGLTGSSRIVLDDDALGYGWYVGAMSETVPDGTMDLLTVLTHELGHVLGLSDLDGQQTPDRIMAGTLQPGQRRSVSVADLLTGDQPINENVATTVDRWTPVGDLFAVSDSATAEETTAATRIALDADAIVLQPAMGTRDHATNKSPKLTQVAGQGTVIPVKSQQELDLLDDLFTSEIAKGDILLFPFSGR